jgi:hypothetical protein
MPKIRTNTAFFCVAAGLLGFGLPSAISACCALSPEDEMVIFGGQRNIVIWDKAAGVEHFIREANFKASSAEFGFVAPTPTVPELASADREAFQQLAALAPPPPPSMGCSAPMDAATSSKAAGGVEVVQEVDVAGYKAKTLKATDSAGLAAYLKGQGFASSPDFEKWLGHYVKKGWFLTSFIVTSELGAQGTSPVRMSFKTDKPFNPYYVPSNNRVLDEGSAPNNSSAGLQVFLVSVDSLKPEMGLGTGKGWVNPTWQVEMKAKDVRSLASTLKIPLASLANGANLSYFRDWDFARTESSEDVFFVPSGRMPAFVQIALTLGAVTVLLLAVAKVVLSRRARAAG